MNVLFPGRPAFLYLSISTKTVPDMAQEDREKKYSLYLSPRLDINIPPYPQKASSAD
jgi:hypothetical protein